MANDRSSFEGYTSIERLASGPVTTLYQATHQIVGRKVVIKTLTEGILPDSAFGSKLEHEAFVLSVLKHPSVVVLYDFKRTDGYPWLVREWVPGWSVSELLQRLGHCSPALAVGIATQVADALAHAHMSGITHRALHADTIVVTQAGDAKITSFSQADAERIAPRREPETEPGFASPVHLPPEQLLGDPADARSDVYALGSILFQMLTGTLHNKSTKHPLETLPHDLKIVLAQCLATQPSERFANGKTLHRALLEVLHSLGGVTPQATTVAELQRLGLALTAPTIWQPPTSQRPTVAGATITRPSRKALALMVIAVVLLGLTAVAFKRCSQGDDAARPGLDATGRAEVRVVVDPWARVYVNDRFFDVTPFAEPVILPPGTHQFRFEHPNAAQEKRQVSVVSGETIVLDVRMNVAPGQRSPGSAATPTPVPSGPDPGP